jgi:putative endopeptidase
MMRVTGWSCSFGPGWLGLATVVLACGQPSPATPRAAPLSMSATAAPPAPAPPLSGLHFDIAAVDPHADPCADFYDYACGGWRATHPVPPDQARFSRYAEMTAVNLERERTIVEDAARGHANASPAERRVGAFYSACMDEAGIEARGLAPIDEILAAIDAIHTKRDAVAVIADLQAHGVDALFSAYPEPDPHDTKKLMLWFDTGRLGLREPTVYDRTDERAVALRAKYVEHLGRIFRLLGANEAGAKASASRVLAFETSLAKKALSAVERRRRESHDHPMTVAELEKRFTAIDWPAYFAKVGALAVERVNVAEPAWLDEVNVVLASADLASARDYLRVLVVRDAEVALPKALQAEEFDFNQRTLRGAQEMAPRWRRCLKMVDDDVGDDVGRIFVARYYSDADRARMKKMVDALMAAYRADIEASDWLSAPTRAAAITKLSEILVVTGASNRPRSFDGLRVEPDDPFGNLWRGDALHVAQDFADMGAPTDREKFFDALPQESEGFGSKSNNAVGFTAGFLQPPVFDARMDDAVNFGGLGGVIGHELSHRFDDEGRKYDSGGNLRPWWTPEDVAHFEEHAKCFVDEYSGFHTDDGSPVDGKLTLGENIADNGGTRLSYAALRPSDAGPKIDGFTPAQRFFLGWGQIRCENVTPEAARRQAEGDEHAPGRWRVNGVVSNMPEFARAFSCSPGAPMAPAKRCAVW